MAVRSSSDSWAPMKNDHCDTRKVVPPKEVREALSKQTRLNMMRRRRILGALSSVNYSESMMSLTSKVNNSKHKMLF